MGLLVTTRESAITRPHARSRCHSTGVPAPKTPRPRIGATGVLMVAVCRFHELAQSWRSAAASSTERWQMKAKAESRLTPRERLARRLTYSAVGPLDVTRGVVGLGVHSAQATASALRRRYRRGQLARDIAAAQETIAQELAAAQVVVTNLPQALQEARRSQRRSQRPLVIAGVVVAVLAGGAVAFSIVRRSSSPEPSPRPPSVDVQPRP